MIVFLLQKIIKFQKKNKSIQKEIYKEIESKTNKKIFKNKIQINNLVKKI